ncbi:asparagine synthase-related protein [Halorubrum amylolyticum]|uniref:asparagine synthase-related protein n=1 Tax=Halorubrum amylolyticum TaxID=2508724 RepID=UPI0013E8F11A|nr:asparagine synthase-related protein [Halorubrum amylolyticum]
MHLGGGAPRHSLNSLEHLSTYAHETVSADHEHFLGYTYYLGYPVFTLETEECIVYFEGYCYDDDDVRERLRSLVPALFDPTADDVTQFIRRTDGEFLVVGIDRQSGRVAVVNDAFGRLPVYCDDHANGLVLSREPRFVIDNGESDEFDRMGLAQSLLFGYTLGDRTLWEGVERLVGGTHIVVGGDGETERTRHYEFDFSEKQHADKSVAENAQNLAALFTDACDRRTRQGRRTLLSLSGGLDSRAVAGGFQARDISFVAATFMHDDGRTSDDVEIARQVADAAELNWKTYTLESFGETEVNQLLRMKEGLNPVQMGFIIQFFERLLEEHGHRTTYVTGDGGDKAIPDLTPSANIGSLGEFISYVCSKNAIFKPTTVKELTGVEEQALREEIAAVISTYPESEWNDLYVHFLVAERGRNWLFEGEDRNRGYFWSTSPFYGLQFFEYAMNVPASQKSGYHLYRLFLNELWPAATEIEHADFGYALDSPMYYAVQRGLDLIDGYPRLERIVDTIHDSESSRSEDDIAGRLLSRRLSDQAVKRYFSPTIVKDVANDRAGYSSKQAFTLLTLASEVTRFASAERASHT